MTIARFGDRTPTVGAGTYIHPSADVFGDVTIGDTYRAQWTAFKPTYVELAHRYPSAWSPIVA